MQEDNGTQDHTRRHHRFQRTERLLGKDTTLRISQMRVIIFGVGGVGSWCAESLVRTGIHHLTIVDCDQVAESNINRQLMATTQTVGEIKVEALKRRLLEINPNAQINALPTIYSEQTASEFALETYDYIIDAIDSLQCKCHLILHATQMPGKFFSSMGAALKMDPTRIQVAEFWNVKGCPLAKAIRNRFKRNGTYPKKKFKCVFSEELLKNKGEDAEEPAGAALFPAKASNGSLCHTTGIFGLTLAGLIIQDIWKLDASDTRQE